MTLTILGHQRPASRGWRLLTLLLTGLVLVLPYRQSSRRRPVTPRPRPVPPVPARVRPYLIAEELRRERCAVQAGLSWLAAHDPDPVPEPAPGPAQEPAPGPELPRRVPGEHAPPLPDPRLAVPAASTGPPSAETLQHVLAGLQGLDIGTEEKNEIEDPPTVPLAVIRS